MKILISLNGTSTAASIKALLSKIVRMSKTEPKNAFTKAAEAREARILQDRGQLVKDISAFLGPTKARALKEIAQEYSKDFYAKDARISRIYKEARTQFPSSAVREQNRKAKWLKETLESDKKLQQLKAKAEKRLLLLTTLLPLDAVLLESLLFQLHLHYMFPVSRALKD